MNQDFPFTIRDIANLLNLHIRHKNAVSLDVNCPFCDDRKGKMNLNLQKNVFKCNRCGESGGMLALYGKLYGVDNQTACKEIKDALGRNDKCLDYSQNRVMIAPKEPEIESSVQASDEVKNKTYTVFFSMLILSETHKQKLLERGFTPEQIEKNGYKSTPVFGFKRITKRLIEAGCIVEGVPGFYQEKDGSWSVHFSPKAAGFLVPIRNIEGLIVGAQIRLDHPYDGRKYIWFSSANYHKGASSGSPVHLSGVAGDGNVYVTEGPLKGDLAHALSGRTFACVPGANQYANIGPFLKQMKEMGSEHVFEAYDMDKLLKPVCRGDYDEKCINCPIYKKDWKNSRILCDRKMRKRNNIQNGCSKLAGICKELGLSGTCLTWDVDEDGDWAEHTKGVDDYLHDLQMNR